MCHCMFGMLALTADQFLRLVNRVRRFRASGVSRSTAAWNSKSSSRYSHPVVAKSDGPHQVAVALCQKLIGEGALRDHGALPPGVAYRHLQRAPAVDGGGERVPIDRVREPGAGAVPAVAEVLLVGRGPHGECRGTARQLGVSADRAGDESRHGAASGAAGPTAGPCPPCPPRPVGTGRLWRPPTPASPRPASRSDRTRRRSGWIGVASKSSRIDQGAETVSPPPAAW